MKRNDLEHQEQVKLFKWLDKAVAFIPQLAVAYAIPNAAKRSPRLGAYMKAEGLRSGVPDICIPAPSGDYCGLYIEMKIGKNKPTAAQLSWIEALRIVGHRVEVCYSEKAAIDIILDYFKKETAR